MDTLLGVVVCVLAVCCYLLFRNIADQAKEIQALKDETANQLTSIRESAELINSGSHDLAMTQDQIRELQVQINDLEEKLSFLAGTRHRK